MKIYLQFAALLPAVLAFNDPLPAGYIETGPFGTVSPGQASLPANMDTIRANAVIQAQNVAVANCYVEGKTDPNGLFNFNFNPTTKFFAPGTTFIAFGDSWTTDGSNGNGTVVPPLCSTGSAWKPSANCSYEVLHGRACEGIEWPEYITNTRGLKRHDYAISGAYTDKSFYNNSATDYMDHYTLYKSQGLNVDFDTTTFTIFYGINDWFAGFPSVEFPNGHFPNADFVHIGLPALLEHVKNTIVADGAKNILFIGLPQWGPPLVSNYPSILLEWQQTLGRSINLGFVSLWPLFIDTGADDQAGGPRYGFTQAFTGQCVEYGTIPDAEFFRQCDLNDLYSSFANAHPTTRMHSLMAAYITTAIDSCMAVPLGPAEAADGGIGQFTEIVWNPNPGPTAGAKSEVFEQPATIVTQTVISTVTVPVQTVTQTVTGAATQVITRTLENFSTVEVFKTVSLAPSTVVIPIPPTITTISIGPVVLTVDPSGTPINSPVPTWITQLNAVTPTWTFDIEPPSTATAVTFTAPLTGTATWVSIVTPPPHTSTAPPVVVTGPPGDHTRCNSGNIWQLLWNLLIGGCLPLNVGIKGGLTPTPVKPPGWTGPWTPPVVYPTAPPQGGNQNQPTGTQTQSETSSSSSSSSSACSTPTPLIYDFPGDPENVALADITDPDTRKRSLLGLGQVNNVTAERIRRDEILGRAPTGRHFALERCSAFAGATVTHPSFVALGAAPYYTLGQGTSPSLTLQIVNVGGRPANDGVDKNQEHVFELRYVGDFFTDSVLGTMSCPSIINTVFNGPRQIAGLTIGMAILDAIDNVNNMVWVDQPLNQAKSNAVNNNRNTAQLPPQKERIDPIGDWRIGSEEDQIYNAETLIRYLGAVNEYFALTATDFRNTAQQVQNLLAEVTPDTVIDPTRTFGQIFNDWLTGVVSAYPNAAANRAGNLWQYYLTHMNGLRASIPGIGNVPNCFQVYHLPFFQATNFNPQALIPPPPNHLRCNVPGTTGHVEWWPAGQPTLTKGFAGGPTNVRVMGSGNQQWHGMGSGANFAGQHYAAFPAGSIFGAQITACQNVFSVNDLPAGTAGVTDVLVVMVCGNLTGKQGCPMGFQLGGTLMSCAVLTQSTAAGTSDVLLCSPTAGAAVSCAQAGAQRQQGVSQGAVSLSWFPN